MDRKALRDLLHIRWEQGDKAAAAARSINEMVGQDVLSNRVAQYWFKLFREGRQATTHKRGAGRRPTVNKRVLAQRLQRKKDISTRELASGVCSQNTAWQWLRKNGYRSRAGRFVPHDLTPAQKENRVTACLQLLRRHRQGRFLRRIVTTDECWVCYDGRVRKPQWLKPNEVPEPTPKPDPHGKKRMLSVFWTISGPVYWELLPRNTIDLYCHLLDTVNVVLTDERLEGRRQGQVVFQQDNARPHVSNVTRDKIRYELGWDLVPHPPYSPDIAPSDYHLFRSLKNFMRGKRFHNDQEVDFEVEAFFASKMGSDFYKRGIKKLPTKWRTIVNMHGEYLI